MGEGPGRTVLILGTGGTHNTAAAVARDESAARVLTASRRPAPAKGWISYEEAVRSGAQVVINTTPKLKCDNNQLIPNNKSA